VAGSKSLIHLLILCGTNFSLALQLVTPARGQDQQQNAAKQDARQIVQQAVQTELAADRDDHSRWLYYEVDRKPRNSITQWVAETPHGDLDRVLEEDSQKLSAADQQKKMESFIQNLDEQAQRRKAGQHDDDQATELLKLLPNAFLWTGTGNQAGKTTLHFQPAPGFHPPDREARVFASMEGDMTVDDAQHRIVSLKGRLIRDVKFGGGLFATLKAGGTFDVERRETGKTIWQITETHVHIEGHALLFKSISEQEDDVKTRFKALPDNLSFQQAEKELLAESN
jgi:hypothetical protein